MRNSRTWIALGLTAALGLGAGLAAARAGAEEGGGMPPPQKQLKCAVSDGLLGTWTTESKAAWGEGKGRAVYALGVGGTAMLLTYENQTAGAPADQKFHGHGVYKVSDDGKTITMWWLDTHSAEPMKLTGPLTDKGYDVKGKSPHGEMRMTLEKKGEGWEFKMFAEGGEQQMTETYTRAAAK